MLILNGHLYIILFIITYPFFGVFPQQNFVIHSNKIFVFTSLGNSYTEWGISDMKFYIKYDWNEK